jgi:uncharacterized protein YabE (DUF348 family)
MKLPETSRFNRPPTEAVDRPLAQRPAAVATGTPHRQRSAPVNRRRRARRRLRDPNIVTLIVDGVARQAGTHQTTVGAVLRDNDIALHPEDLVLPPPATLITPGLAIEVRRAHHVTVRVDGRTLETRTHENQPLAILAGLDVRLGPSDLVIVDGEMLPLAQAQQSGMLLREDNQIAGLAFLPAGAPPSDDAAPPELIEIQRAVPLTVTDNGMRFTVQTTAVTLGEALTQAGITLYLGDSVQPALATRTSAGLSVEIRRSIPVTIDVDGQTVRTRTFRGSVGEVLAEAGIALVGDDYTVPAADSAVTPDIHIQVVRIKEEILTEQESIPFDSVWQGDPTLEIATSASTSRASRRASAARACAGTAWRSAARSRTSGCSRNRPRRSTSTAHRSSCARWIRPTAQSNTGA